MRRILLILVVVSACHGKRAGKDFFGTQVTPPGVLAQIRPGMTLAQVKAIAPDAKDDPGKGLLLAKPASNVKLYAITDRDLVEYTYADYAGDDGIAVLTQAWGPPDKEPDRSDPHDVAWRSTTTGWRASVFCGNGTETTKIPPFCTIKFHPHLPLEMMFGKAIVPPGELAKTKARMTLAELKAATHLAELTDESTQAPIRILDFDGVAEQVAIVDGRLMCITYTVPASSRAAMEKAWGAPKVQGDHAVWFDAVTGWSALVRRGEDPSKLDLEFDGYKPLSGVLDLLETVSKSSTVEEAFTAHPDLNASATKLGFYVACNEFTDPMFRYAHQDIVGMFPARNGVQLVLENLDPKRELEIIDLLTKRWGSPTKSSPTKSSRSAEQTEYRFAKHGVLIHLGDSLALQVGSDA